MILTCGETKEKDMLISNRDRKKRVHAHRC